MKNADAPIFVRTHIYEYYNTHTNHLLKFPRNNFRSHTTAERIARDLHDGFTVI